MSRALQPPEELVDALQDRVHLDVGNARAAKSVKVRSGLSDDAIQQVMACAMERAALRERIGAEVETLPLPCSAGG